MSPCGRVGVLAGEPSDSLCDTTDRLGVSGYWQYQIIGLKNAGREGGSMFVCVGRKGSPSARGRAHPPAGRRPAAAGETRIRLAPPGQGWLASPPRLTRGPLRRLRSADWAALYEKGKAGSGIRPRAQN